LDSFQLEPVGIDPHIFSWREDCFFEENKYELTEVKRYDGVLLNIATELITNKEAHFKAPETDDLQILPKFNKSLLEDIREDNNYIVLTSTNQKRVLYNQKIRATRFKTVEDLDYAQNNDAMVSVSNSNHYSNGETFKMKYPQLLFETEIRVPDKRTEEMSIYKALIYKNQNKIVVFIPDLKEPSLHGAQIFDAHEEGWFRFSFDIQKMLFVNIPKRNLKFWNKDVIIATYGYAISCHKAQGQEWDNVYIDASWLMPAWDSARWFYTAITRAKKKVQVTENKYLTTS